MSSESIDPTAPPVLFWDSYATASFALSVYNGKHSITGLTYVTLGLVGETGEYAEHCKRVIRDDGNVLTAERVRALCEELGDVCWYMTTASRELRFDFSECLMKNPPGWLRTSVIGSGTPTGLSITALRLARASATFAAQVEGMLSLTGGIATDADHPYLRAHLSAVYYCASQCAAQLGKDLREIASANFQKTRERYPPR